MTSAGDLRDGFFQECEELLESLAEGLAALGEGARDAETVNAVFRAVHSIKGGAGAFGLGDLVAFAHRFEAVLDAVRAGSVPLDAPVLRTLLRAADHLSDQVEGAARGLVVPPAATEGVLHLLGEVLAGPAAADAPWGLFGDGDEVFAPVPLDLARALGEATDAPASDPGPVLADGPALRLRFAPHPALYDNGHDPALLLRALAELGPVDVTADLSALPPLGAHDPRRPALAWDVTLWTEDGETAVQEVFEFVHGLCDLEVRPAPPLGLAPAAPRAGAAPAGPAGEADPAGPLAEAAAPLGPSTGSRGPRPTLRVDLDRVDRLIDGVGELIVNQAMIAQALADRGLGLDDDLVARSEDYRLLARDIQEAVMAIRAQAVKPLFQRLSRTLRDATEATGKQAVLLCEGEGTEVDRTVIERLADPLTHLVRNAVDHGIEPPAAREARGKPQAGTVRLSAAHRSGSVVVTVADDGAGLDRGRILARARARGLVGPDADLAEDEAHGLLFLPGFSTAEAVSAMSGRGVGLDVVRTAVAGLGGRISVASAPGEGTEWTIQLPLTLAVMDGMIVSVAGQTMVLPLAAVLETIRPAPGDLHRLGRDGRVLRVRGQVVPVVDLAEALGFAPAGVAAAGGDAGPPLLLLVEAEDGSRWALVVQAVHDQRQVVIKGLDANFGAVPGISAATVLGDGRIALILDPDALTRRARAGRMPPPAPQASEALHAHG